MSTYERTIIITGIVFTAMAAGAFFPFSTFAIRGLKRLPPSQGAVAMQELNKEAPSPLFMLLLFGSGVVCLLIGVHAVAKLEGTDMLLRLAGSAIYILGVVVMTIVYHVPRNDRLAELDANSPEGIAYWSVYLSEWVAMNHVRTIAPLVTSVLFLISLELA